MWEPELSGHCVNVAILQESDKVALPEDQESMEERNGSNMQLSDRIEQKWGWKAPEQ